jgi:kanamycin kinase
VTASPPSVLAELAPGWHAALAYQLVPSLATWRLEHPDGSVRFAKVDQAGRYPTLRAESERMIWAAPYLPVPKVVELAERDGVTVLLTEGLAGHDATDERWQDDMAGLVAAFARGLAAFHAAVEEEWCPFRFDLERSLDHVARRVEAQDHDTSWFHPEHEHLSPAAALDLLVSTAPDSQDLVVCHGDYCPPNALLTDGEVTGFVDLGELGVADRWWDIAVGSWSVVWNFGAEHEAVFFENYGIEPDPERIAFYRLLYDLVS